MDTKWGGENRLILVTELEPIFVPSWLAIIDHSIDIGTKSYLNQIVNTAPIISFQVPYYITLQTNEVLLFTREMKYGNYYISWKNRSGRRLRFCTGLMTG